MRTFVSPDRQRLSLILLTVVVVVVIGLWWTKTIAFSSSAVVEFHAQPESSDGSVQGIFVAIEVSPEDLTQTAARLARSRGGDVDDYLSDLTITPAPDIAGLTVTARGRTPSAAESLAADAAKALSSYLTEANTGSSGGFVFTYLPRN